MHAERMQNAMSSHILHSVIVCLDLEEMHSLVVRRLARQFRKEIISIRVLHLHVRKIHNVLQKMVEPDALVFHHILAMLTVLDVGQNVFIIPIVPVEWLAFVNIAEIHALVYVAKTLSVKLSIMYQFVLVCVTTKATHSLAADRYHQEYVSNLSLL